MLKIILDIPPSVNHCYVNVPRKGRRLTETAKNWKLLAGYEANQAKRKQGWVYPGNDEKIVILLWAFWPDNRPHDMGNLISISSFLMHLKTSSMKMTETSLFVIWISP